jgi:hypothetical protein
MIPEFYARFFAEIFLYLKQTRLKNNLARGSDLSESKGRKGEDRAISESYYKKQEYKGFISTN